MNGSKSRPPNPGKGLTEELLRLAKPAILREQLAGQRVVCLACAHKCNIPDGSRGICGIRGNIGGELMSPHGWVSSIALDPIEKKPFFHVLPGTQTLSFGTLGCNLRCDYCQNWSISQSFRESSVPGNRLIEVTPKEIIAMCNDAGTKVITSTYNEPVISAEWSAEIMQEAGKYSIHGAFVSNGYASNESIDFLKPWIKYFKVDLKTMNPETFRTRMGGELKNVLSTIANLVKNGYWVEVVTLVVPGFNDSPAELGEIAGFLASISLDIPLHFSAFHGSHKMKNFPDTTPKGVLKACETAKKAGLNYVYAGNIPGSAENWENTYCPSCNGLLVERTGYRIGQNNITDGNCPRCSLRIPGIWR